MGTTLSVFGTPIGVPQASIQRQFQMTLFQSDGTTPAASKTGLWWAWWTAVSNVRTTAPDASGSDAVTDVNGVFTANAPNILTAAVDQGFGIIADQDATPDATEASYTGTFDVI